MGGNNGSRLPKTHRAPEAFAGRKLTDRSLTILEIVGRYRLVATSAILRLAGGNEAVTHRHLQLLYHRKFVGRVNRPGNTRNTEFAYFLENSPEMRALLKDPSCGGQKLLDIDISRGTTGHGCGAAENRPGRLLFLEHELMISDFHADMELATKESGGRVQLEEWRQGTSTWDRVPDGDGRVLPHRPDGYLVLRFPTAPPGQQRARFFYEADRGTTSTTRFKDKLRAYLAFFLSGQYREKYGAEKIRAVLVEAITENRMQQLVAVASDLAASEPLAGVLFWFAASGTLRAQGGFAALWSTPSDGRVRRVLD